MFSSLVWRVVALAVVLLVIAACSGSAVTPSGPGSPAASTGPSATLPAIPSTSPSDGATATDPSASDPGIPKPGQLDVHPIKAESLSAAIDGRHVVITIHWTSGVEPCNTLDTILVQKGDHSFAMTLREGHGSEDVMCIEIAQMKRAEVDLGDLEPGRYTITDATGGAAPIEVVVT